MSLKIASTVGAVAMLAAAFAAGPAAAGDNDGNFMIRLQGTYLDTNDHTKSISATGAPGVDLTQSPNFLKGETTKEVLPTATLTYFFNKNIAAELFCCFATTDVNLYNNSGKLGNIAKTWMFPPAVTLQYHFTDFGPFKPYVGAGAQYIHYFSTTRGDNFLQGTSAQLTDSFGPVLQAGFDYGIGGGWYLNADVKKSWLQTDVKISNVTVPAALGNIDAKHSVDPLTVSFGVGYRFNIGDLFARGEEPAPMK